MGGCIGTCGHDTSLGFAFDEGGMWTVEAMVGEHDGPAISYGTYCEACVKQMLAEGWGYKTEEEAWRATERQG